MVLFSILILNDARVVPAALKQFFFSRNAISEIGITDVRVSVRRYVKVTSKDTFEVFFAGTDGVTYVTECCARHVNCSVRCTRETSGISKRRDRANNLVTAFSEDEGRSAVSREWRILHRPPQRRKHHKSLTLKLVRDRHYDIDDVALSARSCNLHHT